jgi:release factor glutamine methyltransferase
MGNSGEFLTCLEILRKSSEFLARKGAPSPKCDSEWIVSTILKKKRMSLYLQPEEILTEEELSEIREMVVRRGKREPLQHILGNVNFAGLLMKCDHRALIPRPETETMTEHILNRIPKSFDGKILDLGTGSGAILFALCSSLVSATGIGIDKSEMALSLAAENLRLHGLENRVNLRQLDWFSEEIEVGKVDLVVSNPPYLILEEWEHAEPEVKVHDPKEALVAKEDGFSDIRKIIQVSGKILSPGGFFAIEFGVSHATPVKDALARDFKGVELLKDLSHRTRFAVARKA